VEFQNTGTALNSVEIHEICKKVVIVKNGLNPLNLLYLLDLLNQLNLLLCTL
jgi:hypothetical protein